MPVSGGPSAPRNQRCQQSGSRYPELNTNQVGIFGFKLWLDYCSSTTTTSRLFFPYLFDQIEIGKSILKLGSRLQMEINL